MYHFSLSYISFVILLIPGSLKKIYDVDDHYIPQQDALIQSMQFILTKHFQNSTHVVLFQEEDTKILDKYLTTNITRPILRISAININQHFLKMIEKLSEDEGGIADYIVLVKSAATIRSMLEEFRPFKRRNPPRKSMIILTHYSSPNISDIFETLHKENMFNAIIVVPSNEHCAFKDEKCGCVLVYTSFPFSENHCLS